MTKPDSDTTQVRATPAAAAASIDITAATEISGATQITPASNPSVPGAAPTAISTYSVAAVDLSVESMLKGAPRLPFNGMTVPCLGGIPLLAKLGQGGMGAVYFGVHTRLMLEVAVKVLPFQLADQDPTMVQRFYREAQIAAKVKSRHLVSVMDVNQDAGLFYLVMEFVSGVTAGAYCKRCINDEKHPGIDEATALDICIAATEGLVAAHNEGVIHRDIKPDNILIPREKGSEVLCFADAKLADLGLARQDDTVQSLTAAQNTMGTPGFMSPEQANDSKKAGKPADVFSMGATLYALLCGRPPFTGATSLETILSTIQKPHRPIGQVRRDLGIETAALIDRCLNKKPERRHPDGVALLAALQDCRAQFAGAATMPGRARRATGATGIARGATGMVRGATEQTLDGQAINAAARAAVLQPKPAPARPEPVRRGGVGKLLFLLCGAALLAGGGFWMAQQRELADQVRKDEEARQTQEAARKQREQEDARAGAGRANSQAADQSWEHEMQAKLAKALHEGDKPKPRSDDAGVTVADSDNRDHAPAVRVIPVLPPPDPAHPAPPPPSPQATAISEKVQRLRKKFNAVSDELQRAATEQRRNAEQINLLTAARRQAQDKVNQLQKDAADAHDEAKKAKDALKRTFGGNKQLTEDAAKAANDARDADDAVKSARDDFDRLDKQCSDATTVYNNANAELGRLHEDQSKSQRDLMDSENEANSSKGQ